MHRQIDIHGIGVEVFDTKLGAQYWLKKNKADCIVLVRNSYFFQRKHGSEITVLLNATESADNSHLLRAANTIADEVERILTESVAA